METLYTFMQLLVQMQVNNLAEHEREALSSTQGLLELAPKSEPQG